MYTVYTPIMRMLLLGVAIVTIAYLPSIGLLLPFPGGLACGCAVGFLAHYLARQIDRK